MQKLLNMSNLSCQTVDKFMQQAISKDVLSGQKPSATSGKCALSNNDLWPTGYLNNSPAGYINQVGYLRTYVSVLLEIWYCTELKIGPFTDCNVKNQFCQLESQMCRFKNVSLRYIRPPKMKRRSLPAVREERKVVFVSDCTLYCTVIATAVISYMNSLNGEFVHDDIPAIVTNGDVTGKNSLKQLFLNDFWGTPMADANSHKSYRPLTTLSFRVNFAISGLRTWWWHACNVILHAACCALVARACVTVARLQRPFAALAASLFAVHPVHSEAVAGIVGRADVLACIFFLASLLAYHRPTSHKKCVWLSILLGALSMLAKETGVTVLVLNLVIDLYRCWPFVKRSLNSLKVEKRCAGLSVRSTKVVASLALLICLRLALLQGTWPSFSTQDNPAAFNPNFFARLMTFCYLAAFNWWLLLCPWSLSHDWQMGSVPLVTSGWDCRNLLTCAAFGALTLLTYKCIADVDVQRHSPMVIGLLLLVIPFVPASNLMVTVGFVIAERVLYIPSVGSVIITAYGVQLMWSRPGTKAFLALGLAVLAVSSMARTHRRNADWKDRATLLRADLVTLPQNAKLHYNFANFLRETEQQESAIKHYKEALRLWPTYASAHNNLGTLVSGAENAEQHFLQAIRFSRHHVNAHYNLGKLYKKMGRFSQAVAMLEKCLWLQPRFVQALVELLSLVKESEKPPILNSLIQIEPENVEHRIAYGDWYKNKGLPGPALPHYLEALRLSFKQRNLDNAVRPDLAALRSAALIYRALGQKSKTLQILTRWHTWRRGWPSSAAMHVYLREWRLKMELRGWAQIYSNAVNSIRVRSTKCIDHSQLAVGDEQTNKTRVFEEIPSLEHLPERDKHNSSTSVANKFSNECKSSVTEKRDLTISLNLKMIHSNKSKVHDKFKKCSLRKKKSVKKTYLIQNVISPLVHVSYKNFSNRSKKVVVFKYFKK